MHLDRKNRDSKFSFPYLMLQSFSLSAAWISRTARTTHAANACMWSAIAVLLIFVAQVVQGEEHGSDSETEPTVELASEDTDSDGMEEPSNDSKTETDEDDADETFSSLQEILDYEATQDDYSRTERCIDSRRIREYDVLSQRFILIQMRDKSEKYLVQLKRKCVGLAQGVTLRFDTRRGNLGQMCINDYVRADMSAEWGPPCRLPGFEPVNDVQLEQLIRGLKTQRVE